MLYWVKRRFDQLLLAILFLIIDWHGKSQQQYSQPPTQQQQVEEAENGITEEPLVQCGVDSLSMEIRTKRPFSGRLFVKGFSQEQQCQMLGNGSQTQFQFAVHFGQCGLRRSREINGVSVQTTVVVSFHPIFITKLDRAYRLNCFYTEARKAVSQQLEVGQLTTTGNINRQGTMPQCRYDILWQNAQGQPIRFARIGDIVFHRWSCHSEQPHTYCMRVHSCTVTDGQGGQNVEVLDRNGCGVDSLLLRDLDYTGDLTAGQTASVFKFADKPTLHFNCQIELTLRDQLTGCEFSKPKCSPPSRPSSGKSPPENYQKGADESTTTESSTAKTPIVAGSSPGISPLATEKTLPPPTFRPSTPPPILVKESALSSAQFKVVSPNGSTISSGEELVPFTAATPPSQNGYTDKKQTQVPPSKFATEHYTTGESGEMSGTSSEEVVGEWSQQDAIYQDEMNSPTRRRTPGPRSIREDTKVALEKRKVRKVADFDLPERSLVVIELDEHSLAHQPLIWRLLNSSIPAGIQCSSSLAAQVPHWTILLVLLFLIVLLSALLWTNWPSRIDLLLDDPQKRQQQREYWQRQGRQRSQEETQEQHEFGHHEHLDLNNGPIQF